MKITTVGIDLAKNVFQVHGIDERGKAILGKQLRRAQVAVFFANLPPCVIGMEACASAHHWARTLQGFGHTVRLIAAQFVKPYVKTLIDRLTKHLKELDRQVKEFEREIIAWHRSSELSRKLEKIPGIGPLAASALVASIADAHSFDNGRQVSAWLGLVPRQSSSGGKPTLLGMSKRGDAYLRTLLIHGARSAILAAKNKVDNTEGWLTNLLKRRHPNIAAVALANKNVRTVWALLAHGREFKADYVPTRMAA